jgi:hypothetical protein
VKCHNQFSQRLSALDTAEAQGTDAWIPTKLSSARSAHNGNTKQNVTSNLCVDSGASRDLFPDRRYFINYKDIFKDAGHYVVVADNSRVPISKGLGPFGASLPATRSSSAKYTMSHSSTRPYCPSVPIGEKGLDVPLSTTIPDDG